MMKNTLLAGVLSRAAFAAVACLLAARPSFGAGQLLGPCAGTSDKPQSKIWYNDGSYWAVLEAPDGAHIYRLQGSSWSKGDFVDSKASHTDIGHEDVLWNGKELFVLVYDSTPRLYKYTYDAGAKRYSKLAGFPVDIPTAGSYTESIVLDQDSTGRLWATYKGDTRIYVVYSTSPDHRSWQTPGILLQSGVSTDDLSTIIAFGGDRIGVFWSDQARWEFGFRYHRDGDAPDQWSATEVIYAGGGHSDDHIHVVTDGAGRVFAISKDTGNNFAVHRRNTNGTWTTSLDVTNGQNGTRAILMIDPPAQKLYALYTCWSCGASDPILYRVGSTETLAFGAATTFLTASGSLNDVTGMKQRLPSGSLIAIAGNNSEAYWNGWGSPPSGNGFGGSSGSQPPPPPPPPPSSTGPPTPPANATAAMATHGPVAGVAATYLFDEPAGVTVLNAAAAAPNGTLGAPGANPAGPARVAGVSGGGLRFDGLHDYVFVPDAPELRFAASFTLEAWVRRTGTGASQVLIAKEGSGRNYRLRLTSPGDIELAWKDAAGGSHTTTSARQLTDAAWHHVAAVRDVQAGEDRIYVDGKLDRTRADSALPGASTDPLLLGARTASKPRDFLQGELDMVRLASAALYHADFTPPLGYDPPAVTPYVQVLWSASASSKVAGYQVYRSVNAEPYALLTPSLVHGSSYGDTLGVDGVLCYRVTAVDNLGQESTPTAPACITFGKGPTPPLGPATPSVEVVTNVLPPLGNAAFQFDEGSGSVASDLFATGSAATLGSSKTGDAAEPTWVPGIEGTALRFDGATQYAEVLDRPALRFDASWTLEAWIQRQQTDTYAILLCKESNSIRSYRLALQPGGNLELSWKDKGGPLRWLQSTAPVPAGEWHHVAAVFDRPSLEARLFIDGQLAGQATLAGVPPLGTDKLRFGARIASGGAKDAYKGDLDLVRLTPEALYHDPFTPSTSFPARSLTRHRIDWTPAQQGSARLLGYRVYRRLRGGPWESLGEVPSTQLQLLAPEPTPGEVCYRVTAFDLLGLESAASGDRCRPWSLQQQERRPSTDKAMLAEPAGLRFAVGPNPCNPTTQIGFHLERSTPVQVHLYDVSGRLVIVLHDGTLPAGEHRLSWNGRDAHGRGLSSGVYMLRLHAGTEWRTAKLILAK